MQHSGALDNAGQVEAHLGSTLVLSRWLYRRRLPAFSCLPGGRQFQGARSGTYMADCFDRELVRDERVTVVAHVGERLHRHRSLRGVRDRPATSPGEMLAPIWLGDADA